MKSDEMRTKYHAMHRQVRIQSTAKQLAKRMPQPWDIFGHLSQLQGACARLGMAEPT